MELSIKKITITKSISRRMFQGSLLISCILLVSCGSSKKLERFAASKFHEAPEFSKGFSGLAVYDPSKKEMIYEHNSAKYFTPASNTKLFTLYTGLKILGDSVPALKYTINGNSLIFKGTGDPSLLNPDLPDSKIISFLAETNYQLFYYPPVHTEAHFGPGWAWDDYNSYYSAEKIDLPIYGNLIRVNMSKTSTRPVIQPEIFKDSLSHAASDTKNKYVRRAINSNKMKFGAHERSSDFSQSVPIKFHDQLIPQLLSDTLKKPVGIYTGKLKSSEFNRTLYSIPADSMYQRMMQVSDNFIAEQILLMAADKISDSLKTRTAINHMKKEFLLDLPDEPVWVDGSGLSRYNLFTPRSMVKLLEKISAEMPQEKLFKLLAVGGESGTLKNYYKAEDPYIFAKTGTLSNNHSLSGYLKTKSGKILIFSFMNSNYTVPTSAIKKGMTAILEYIRDTY